MTTCVIEVNDYELRLATRGEVLASSPGQATLVDGRVEIGSAAMAVVSARIGRFMRGPPGRMA